IALIAVSDSLPNVVRGSMAGSVVSNILLVLGVSFIAGPDNARLDLRSLAVQLGLVAIAVVLLLIPSIPGWHGDPERRSLQLLSIIPAVILLVLYLVTLTIGLRRTSGPAEEPSTGWSLKTSLLALALATVATALISEVLVH